MSVLERLTEGIINRDLSKEGAALYSKWEKTGLLEGIGDDRNRQTMAVLLENQAKELLREASSMSAGDVEGFASVAFPIVRRVFGGLIANDLVSVQPMSLPSGLIFFLDFTRPGGAIDGRSTQSVANEQSVYGGGKIAAQITGGIDLTGNDGETGFYNLVNGYSSPLSSSATGSIFTAQNSGSISNSGVFAHLATATGYADAKVEQLLRYDPDLLGTDYLVASADKSSFGQLNVNDLVTIVLTDDTDAVVTTQARRLTQIDPDDATSLVLVVTGVSGAVGTAGETAFNTATSASWRIDDNFAGSGIGGVIALPDWGLEGAGDGDTSNGTVDTIAEIDIKVDAIPVTAMTKKLKAKWTPELAQDLNAYHNMDAEVELTSILSEHIALEIDQEILEDLVVGATAGRQYWSRRPGKFLDRTTGGPVTTPGDFTGNVSEWYETLAETINDVSAQIHRKTLRGGANFVVCSPEVANLLEFTAGFRGSVTHDDDRGTIGAMKVGSLSKKFDVYVDAYFPRNVVLVGRKGSSFLESGYVYAPYVPLQMTPTIFGTEDFVPRKGVMTRYAKKMVRPDMYGLVIVEDLLG